MSENVSSLQLSIPNDKIVEIENINFAGVETDNDNNEIFGDRLANFAFHTRGNIELYKSKIENHKVNKHLFKISGVLLFLSIGIFLHTIISAILSSNPFSPPPHEIIISNITLFLLIFCMGAYLFFIKTQKKLLIINVFEQVSNLANFFTSQQRFNFIQYVLNNKNEFPKSDDKNYFTQKIKELKILDKNNDVIGFTLLALYLYNNDIVDFYQKVIRNNNFSYTNNQNISSVIKYFEEKTKQSINKE
jgi:hypothetical protein